jgi:hypothetical protein
MYNYELDSQRAKLQKQNGGFIYEIQKILNWQNGESI